ncbi:hypothetical protein HDU76_011220 [Blyttiomyces sp. JEL0837]|nr:hypothetical protein HDU76_011220 [Blyttiomyces sp. JEL0837]
MMAAAASHLDHELQFHHHHHRYQHTSSEEAEQSMLLPTAMSVKLKYAGISRRFILPLASDIDSNYTTLLSMTKSIFRSTLPNGCLDECIEFRWVDEEGDIIRLGSGMELTEAIRVIMNMPDSVDANGIAVLRMDVVANISNSILSSVNAVGANETFVRSFVAGNWAEARRIAILPPIQVPSITSVTETYSEADDDNGVEVDSDIEEDNNVHPITPLMTRTPSPTLFNPLNMSHGSISSTSTAVVTRVNSTSSLLETIKAVDVDEIGVQTIQVRPMAIQKSDVGTSTMIPEKIVATVDAETSMVTSTLTSTSTSVTTSQQTDPIRMLTDSITTTNEFTKVDVGIETTPIVTISAETSTTSVNPSVSVGTGTIMITHSDVATSMMPIVTVSAETSTIHSGPLVSVGTSTMASNVHEISTSTVPENDTNTNTNEIGTLTTPSITISSETSTSSVHPLVSTGTITKRVSVMETGVGTCSGPVVLVSTAVGHEEVVNVGTMTVGGGRCRVESVDVGVETVDGVADDFVIV